MPKKKSPPNASNTPPWMLASRDELVPAHSRTMTVDNGDRKPMDSWAQTELQMFVSRALHPLQLLDAHAVVKGDSLLIVAKVGRWP